MMGGALKISLHQSGSWHAGFTAEAKTKTPAIGSRHWEIWKRGAELSEGVTRAWYLLVPDSELRTVDVDPKAREIPAVGPNHALSLEVLLVQNVGSAMNFDDAHLVARLRLQGRDESCLILARRVPWGPEQCAWADAARIRSAAVSMLNHVRLLPEHRYFVHGHDQQGVRFGLELAMA